MLSRGFLSSKLASAECHVSSCRQLKCVVFVWGIVMRGFVFFVREAALCVVLVYA